MEILISSTDTEIYFSRECEKLFRSIYGQAVSYSALSVLTDMDVLKICAEQL